MAVEDLHALLCDEPLIVRDPARRGGKPTIAGTRVGVHDVIHYLNVYGGSLERVQQEALEHLSMEQLLTAVEWYHSHREEVDAILDDQNERFNRRVASADDTC
jgi:uncharacterized protein (DUF433 family)